MLLVVDNGSIFTRNLTGLLSQKNIPFKVAVPHLLDLKTLEEYDSFILSGRKKNEKKINEINSKIVRHSVENGAKLLGICYGAEILALTIGGTIRRAFTPQNGDETVEVQMENPISRDRLTVFESHSFEISALPKALIPLASSENCRYEIVRHRDLPIYGTQFHPEMSKDGRELIEEFCRL